MRIRDVRAAEKYFGSFLVVLELSVVNETEIVVKVPVVRVLPNPVLHKFDGTSGFSSTVRRIGREEAGSELISNQQVRIKRGSDFQQWRKFVVGGRLLVMAMSEVLHDARPVNAGHQSVKTEAGALYRFRRDDV